MTLIQPQTRVFDLKGNETLYHVSLNRRLPIPPLLEPLLEVSDSNCREIVHLKSRNSSRPLRSFDLKLQPLVGSSVPLHSPILAAMMFIVLCTLELPTKIFKIFDDNKWLYLSSLSPS